MEHKHGNCLCRSNGDGVPKKSIANIADKQLSLSAYFELLQECSVTPSQSLIGCCKISLKCHPEDTLNDFSKIMKTFPCHNCHKVILEPLLSSLVDKKYSLNFEVSFRNEILKNLSWNKNTHDSEIIALSMRSLRLLNLPDQDIVKMIVSKLKLSSITPTVLAHYANLWQPAKTKNYAKILRHLETSFWKKTGTKNRHVDNRELEDVMFEALALFFPKNFDNSVYLPTCPKDHFVIRLMRQKAEIKKSWECCDRFTRKLHDTLQWKSDPEFAAKYIIQISGLIRALCGLDFPRQQVPHQVPSHMQIERITSYFQIIVGMEGADEVFKYYEQIMVRFFEVVRETRVDSLIHSFDLTINDKLALHTGIMLNIFAAVFVGPREIDTVTTLFDVFLLKMREVLETDDLDHDGEPINMFAGKNSNRLKSSSYCEQIDEKINKHSTALVNSYVREMLECIVKLLRNKMVKTVNLNFLSTLVSLARFKCTLKLRIVRLIFNEIVTQNLCDKETLLKSGMARTIYVNMFHLNDDCNTCAHVGEFIFHEILKMLEPEDKIDFTTERDEELAAALPYVIRNKQKLVDVMYPEGLALIASRLRQGQNIDSLYFLTQTLQTQTKPQDVKSSVCLSELNEPVCERELRTKIFVLDDGTEIRARITPLIKNSLYFSSLLDGRFAEANQEKIRIHDVTTSQFYFLIKYTTFQPAETKLKFNLDFETHLDLYKLCYRFLFDNLCQSLIDSLSSSMTSETLPGVYEMTFGLDLAYRPVRIACMDYVMNIICPLERSKTIRYLFRTFNNEDLAEDILECLKLRCKKIKQDMDSDAE